MLHTLFLVYPCHADRFYEHSRTQLVAFALLKVPKAPRYLVRQVLYNKDVVSSVLTFMRHLDQLKRQPIMQPDAFQGMPRKADHELDPSQPSNLWERTMHAFAQQNIPVSQPLSLPVLSVSLTCPGELFICHDAFLHLWTLVCRILALEAFAVNSCLSVNASCVDAALRLLEDHICSWPNLPMRMYIYSTNVP